MISAKDNHVFSGFSLSSSTLLLFTFWGVDFMQKSSMTSFLANLFVFLQNGTQEWSEISGVCWCFPKWSNQEIFSKSTSVPWYQFCCSLEKEKSSKSRNKSLYLKFTCHGQLFSFWYLYLSSHDSPLGSSASWFWVPRSWSRAACGLPGSAPRGTTRAWDPWDPDAAHPGDKWM